MDAASWQATLDAVQIVHEEGLAPEVSTVHDEMRARQAMDRLRRGQVLPEARPGAGGAGGVHAPVGRRNVDNGMRLAPADENSGGGIAARLARGWHGLMGDYRALANLALDGDDLAMDQWLAMAEKNPEARAHLIESARGQERVVSALNARAATSEAARAILWRITEGGDGEALRSCLELTARVPAFRDLIRGHAAENPDFIGRLGGQVEIPAARDILFDLAATNSHAYDFLITLAQTDAEAFARVVELTVGNGSRVQALARRARDSGFKILAALARVAERDADGLKALMGCGDKFGSAVATLDVSVLLSQVRGDPYGDAARSVESLIKKIEELVRGGRADLVDKLADLEKSYRLAQLPEDAILVSTPADLVKLAVPAENFQPVNYVLIRFGNGQTELRLTHTVGHNKLVLPGNGEKAVAAGRVFYHAESNTLFFDNQSPDFTVTGQITESQPLGNPAVSAFVQVSLPGTRPRPGNLVGLMGRPVAELDFLARERKILTRTRQGVRTLLSAHDVLSEPRRCIWVQRTDGEVEARLILVTGNPEAMVLPGETLVAVGLVRSDLVTGEAVPRRVYLELESNDSAVGAVLLRGLPENPEVTVGPLHDVAAKLARKTQNAGIIVVRGDQIRTGGRYKYVMVLNYAGKPELRVVEIKIGDAEKYPHPDLVVDSDLALVGAGWLFGRRNNLPIMVNGASGNFPTDEDQCTGGFIPAAARSGLSAVRDYIREQFGEEVVDEMYEDD